jgi:AraC-like DNA-binding protein
MGTWPSCLLEPGTAVEWTHAVLSKVPPSFGFVGRVVGEHVIWYVVGGACHLRTERDEQTLRAGSLVWMPPGERCTATTPPRSQPILAYSFRFRVLARGVTQFFAHPAILRADARELEPDLRRLCDEQCVGDEWSAERTRVLLHLIYTALIRPPGARRSGGRLSPDERMRLARYAHRHLARGLTSADLAREVGLGPDRFARLFKASYGVSPRRWLVEQRIAEARFRLAHSREPIGAIAAALGYADRHLFNRQFRAVVGRAPRELREG